MPGVALKSFAKFQNGNIWNPWHSEGASENTFNDFYIIFKITAECFLDPQYSSGPQKGWVPSIRIHIVFPSMENCSLKDLLTNLLTDRQPRTAFHILRYHTNLFSTVSIYFSIIIVHVEWWGRMVGEICWLCGTVELWNWKCDSENVKAKVWKWFLFLFPCWEVGGWSTRVVGSVGQLNGMHWQPSPSRSSSKFHPIFRSARTS